MSHIKTVKEKSVSFLELKFTDKDGAPAVPVSVSYRIDVAETDTEIRPDTAFTPSGSTHELQLTADDNRIVDGGNEEMHLVTLQIDFGGGITINDNSYYLVQNLKKII